MHNSIYLNLDDAWLGELPIEQVDGRSWGPLLRFSAPPALIRRFEHEVAATLPPFVIYGSGDFHHLTAVFVRRAAGPLTLVSFDNHPDWDVRPPRWSCGAWINRALELPQVERISVWGCGNFECWWPHQLFGNRSAERRGKLEVHPWADDRPQRNQQRRGAILRESWREPFAQFAGTLAGRQFYVTIDLDCLRSAEGVTNWESGCFRLADLEWAIGELRRTGRIVAGDICGAYSPPHYARRGQRFVGNFDHPKLPLPEKEHARDINRRAITALLALLADGNDDDPDRNQEGTDD